MAYIIFNLTLEESHSDTNFKAIVNGTNNVPCQRATAQRSLTQALDCTNKRKNHMRREAPIEIASYSTEWPALFAAEAAILKSALVTWLVGEPEHIGSTAVPGLAAKPVIDIMAPVATLQDSLGAIEVLQDYGYLYFPYKQNQMHWFCKPSPELRTHHLHLVPVDSQLWRERLAFRDVLRSDKALATRYEKLKHELAAKFRDDREAYTEGKSSFIVSALKAWSESHGSAV